MKLDIKASENNPFSYSFVKFDIFLTVHSRFHSEVDYVIRKLLDRTPSLGNASSHGIGHFGTQTHHIGFVNGVDCVGKKDDGEVVFGVNHNRSARISRVTEGRIAQQIAFVRGIR